MPDTTRSVIEGFEALHRYFRRLSSHCHGKQGFDDKGMADRIAARSRKRGNGKVATYRCPNCRLWHIGTSRGGK